MLYHLDALLSLWMYSFLYVEEPTITYFETGPTASAWLDNILKNRISEDYFSIIGSTDDKDRLVCLGVAPQNIVELGGEKDHLNAKALPRNYIPFFTEFQRHDDYVSESKALWNNKKPTTLDERNTADFAPRDHLFGRCKPPSDCPIYAYKYPSSPSITPFPISHHKSRKKPC